MYAELHAMHEDNYTTAHDWLRHEKLIPPSRNTLMNLMQLGNSLNAERFCKHTPQTQRGEFTKGLCHFILRYL